MKEIHRIVITGGPCAGKTTAFARIVSEFTIKGYKVFTVPETFTEMHDGGIRLVDYPSLDFQSMLLRQQISKEDMYYKAAMLHKAEKVVIIYDRGVLDPIAYMDPVVADMMIKISGYTMMNLMARYDAVIHMVTAADGAEEAYIENKSKNKARYESVEEAISTDKALLAVWTGHSHLRVIDNSTNFDDKITRVIKEIHSILGIPSPLEIERKFLIESPYLEELKKQLVVSESNIVQTYLCDDGCGYERRIRQRGKAGDYIYYYTEKKKLRDGVRVEKERLISESEYIEFLTQTDFRKKQIRKTRYCFIYDNLYFELDVYPFAENWAILEVELTNENDIVTIPDFIKVIKEVTNDEAYSNYALASHLPS